DQPNSVLVIAIKVRASLLAPCVVSATPPPRPHQEIAHETEQDEPTPELPNRASATLRSKSLVSASRWEPTQTHRPAFPAYQGFFRLSVTVFFRLDQKATFQAIPQYRPHL